MKRKEWVWYQEYKTCSCTEVRYLRKDLTGYCRRHMTQPRRTVKLPKGSMKEEDMGFVES